ncbi:MAG: succinate dehydrogenase, hydrophobic membrane anchor protein [Legionellales bacterium]|nr:succinate dehydrogenase, hydrophobic membrane anchor protein [Legionellales bacterium]
MGSVARSNRGYIEFIIQRLSAIYMLLYILSLLTIIFINKDLDFEIIQDLFSLMPVRIFTLVFIISILSHSWIGMWTIATDYIGNLFVRNLYFIIVFGALFFYLIWSIEIIWGFE